MRYEILENGDGWTVRHNGVEVGQFADQEAALAAIAEHLRATDPHEGATSLSMRYRPRAA